MQRLVQQDARVVAGERAAARVGAVHAGREAHDHEARRRPPERRHRLAPVRRDARAGRRPGTWRAAAQRRQASSYVRSESGIRDQASGMQVCGAQSALCTVPWRGIDRICGSVMYDCHSQVRRQRPIPTPDPRSLTPDPEPRTPLPTAFRADPQAAAAVRPRRLQRRLVLGAVLPAVVRLARLARLRGCRCAGTARASGADTLFIAGLDDYVADVEHVAGVPATHRRFCIGHSMGAAILERMMATRPMRGAALMAPVPPTGLLPVAARLATTHPDYASHMIGLDPTRLSRRHPEGAAALLLQPRRGRRRSCARPCCTCSRRIAARAVRSVDAPALGRAAGHARPVFVIGADADQIASPADVEATARHHGVTASILPGMGHMMMLEPEWKDVAAAIAAWLGSL